MSEIMTLITGPSGSGKELVARAIGLSQFIPYNEKTGQFEQDFLNSFHPINLAALSPTLIESELFGHKKGAFTGANEDRKGYLESCGTYGTVFLDEIGETPLEIQVKLLRALQSREFQRLGESTITKFKGKLIAATNRNLIEEVAAGHFREDFYYRLCADRIQTANLKEMISGNRKELLDLLIHIAKKVAGEENKDSLSKECLTWIEKKIPHQYDWPGNIRELEQCVRNILIRGSYYPEIKPSPVSETNKTILQKFEKCELTLKELNQAYTQHAYSLYKSYEEVGRRLEADRRTIKKYTE
jgi:DNA-binding NtrC family response regulator